jgi:DNA-binding XRE family transcriptional regulator
LERVKEKMRKLDAATIRWREEFRLCRGLLISALRTEKGWSQRELAERAGVSLPWLQAIESNQLRTRSRMVLEFDVITALGSEKFGIKDFYCRVEGMVQEKLGPPPWLKPDSARDHDGADD